MSSSSGRKHRELAGSGCKLFAFAQELRVKPISARYSIKDGERQKPRHIFCYEKEATREQRDNSAQKIRTHARRLFDCVQDWRSETRRLAARSIKSGRPVGGRKAALRKAKTAALANNAKGNQIASQAGACSRLTKLSPNSSASLYTINKTKPVKALRSLPRRAPLAPMATAKALSANVDATVTSREFSSALIRASVR